MNYKEFLNFKRQEGGNHGFNPVFVPDHLFDFQKNLVEWAVQKGRAAIFADYFSSGTEEVILNSKFLIASTKRAIISSAVSGIFITPRLSS